MRPIKAYVVLAALVATGCARAPDAAVEAAVSPATAAPSATAAPPATAVPAANATASAAPGAESAGSAVVIPDAVIDANELVANTPARPVCREVLRPNSNVRTKQCMSAEAWELYDRAEAQRAGELLRTWQGGRYR